MKAKKYVQFFVLCLVGGFVWGSLFHLLMSRTSDLTFVYWETVGYGGGAFALLLYLTFVILARCDGLFTLQNKSGQKALLAYEEMAKLSPEGKYFGEIDNQGVLPRTCGTVVYVERYGIHIAFRYMDMVAKDIPYAQIKRAEYAQGKLTLELHEVKLPLEMRIEGEELIEKLREKGVVFQEETL